MTHASKHEMRISRTRTVQSTHLSMLIPKDNSQMPTRSAVKWSFERCERQFLGGEEKTYWKSVLTKASDHWEHVDGKHGMRYRVIPHSLPYMPYEGHSLLRLSGKGYGRVVGRATIVSLCKHKICAIPSHAGSWPALMWRCGPPHPRLLVVSLRDDCYWHGII